MVPQHEQAIEMADIALDPTVEAGDQVRDLATRIKGAQDPEIELMTGWLTAWGQPMQMDTSEGHDMSAVDRMMTAEAMDSLGTMKGAEFDTMWMEMMTRRHEGAIAMAETEKASGANPLRTIPHLPVRLSAGWRVVGFVVVGSSTGASAGIVDAEASGLKLAGTVTVWSPQ